MIMTICILKYIQIENRIWIFHNITVLLYFDQINAAFVVPSQKGNKTLVSCTLREIHLLSKSKT